jgi:hypothetical protein
MGSSNTFLPVFCEPSSSSDRVLQSSSLYQLHISADFNHTALTSAVGHAHLGKPSLDNGLDQFIVLEQADVKPSNFSLSKVSPCLRLVQQRPPPQLLPKHSRSRTLNRVFPCSAAVSVAFLMIVQPRVHITRSTY